MNSNQVQPVMLIGSMKCGTSKLFEYLVQHPEICPCSIKEPQFFSENYIKYQSNGTSYLSLFNINEKKHKFILDASTGYSKYPAVSGVPKRIKDYNIDPYLIMIVRNPLDRIRSHYNFMRSDLTWKHHITSAHLINTSKYHMQLQQYREIFPEKEILVVDFNELKNKPEQLCAKIFNFIGARPFRINTNESAYQNKTEPVNRLRLKIDLFFERLGLYKLKFLKKILKRCLKFLFPNKQKQLTQKQKTYIKKQLQEDMSLLKEDYQIDTENWGFV